ncbi:MAG: AraC family transcriptional regulator [Spirochaetales bacterium]|uniref:AraC family transcriptional regulator n=1 Tax=Candidatus Thalassospirochaeta sargassi TaxID=3119039 RepID=A0AAJ1IEM3_9SPIO|nr:AraC family transcriptional regulator [Spirochaetales bacterium]
MFSLIDLVLAMGFAWMVSGICLLIINRRRISIPVWSGSLVILVFSLTLFDNFIKPGMLPEGFTMFLFVLSRNSYFLIGPFLWLYTRTLLSEDKMSPADLLHLLPFLAIAVITGLNPEWLIPADAPVLDTVNGGLLTGPEFYRNLLSILSRGGYCAAVFRLIRVHEKSIADYYSRRTLVNTLSWLYYLVIFYFFLFLLNFIVMLIPPLTAAVFHSLTATFVRIVPALLFIFLFSLFAQNQPVPEDLRVQEAAPEPEKPLEDDKYRTSGISPEESRSLYAKLNSTIAEKRLFLDSDLTLNTLADEIGETRHRISEVINRESGENFYGYINGFRLREFIACLNEKRYPHFTITAVAFECGFKSNSAFYSLFKKKMGMAPKDYIQKLSA